MNRFLLWVINNIPLGKLAPYVFGLAVVNAELWWQKLISIFAIVVSIVSPVMVFIV